MSDEEKVPRHLLTALANATRAFNANDLSALMAVNSNLQPLVDAAIAYARRQRPAEPESPDPNPADPTKVSIEHLLLQRFAPPRYATFLELHAEVGGFSTSRLDVFAIGTWRSVGFHGIACEVKVSRGDFMRELRQPEKRKFAERVASECWFVCDKGVATAEEIPARWGLLERNGMQGLVIRKAAPQHDVEPWPPGFVAAIARRSQDPKSPLPKGAWLRNGKEVSDAMLLALVEEMHGEEVKRAVQRARDELWNEHEVSPARQREMELVGAVRQATGRHDIDAEAFRAWAASGARVGPHHVRALREAQQRIDGLLEQLDPPPPEPGPGEERPRWADPCPHPARAGRHEVYVGRGGHYCRACGAESVPGAIAGSRGRTPKLG